MQWLRVSRCIQFHVTFTVPGFLEFLRGCWQSRCMCWVSCSEISDRPHTSSSWFIPDSTSVRMISLPAAMALYNKTRTTHSLEGLVRLSITIKLKQLSTSALRQDHSALLRGLLPHKLKLSAQKDVIMVIILKSKLQPHVASAYTNGAKTIKWSPRTSQRLAATQAEAFSAMGYSLCIDTMFFKNSLS